MKTYTIGQVIYLLSNKETKVFPAQVVEVVVRRTLEGEVTNYFVKMPDNASTVIALDKVDGQVFLSTEELKNFMFENARKNIETIVLKSHSLAEKVFDLSAGEKIQIEDQSASTISDKNEDVVAQVDLGNGVIGRVNLDNIGGDLNGKIS